MNRSAALARDNRRCQDCGAREDLHVHHIDPVRDFADSKEAHYLENLVTLCKYCHPKWEGRDGGPVLLSPSAGAHLADVVEGLVMDWVDRNWVRLSPESAFTTAVWHNSSACNNCFSRLDGRSDCSVCGTNGSATPESDSKNQVTKRARRIGDRLEEQDIAVDRPALRRAVRTLKSKPELEALDTEIYERATKIAVRRAQR